MIAPTSEQIMARQRVLRGMYERERDLHEAAKSDRSTKALMAEEGIDRNAVMLSHWLACKDIADLHGHAHYDTGGEVRERVSTP